MNTSPSTRRKQQAGRSIRVPAHMREIVRFREVLFNLTKREIKLRYKNSALGFVWSMLNPLLYLIIFSIVLGVFLGVGLPWFPFYLLSGLLAWNLFSAGVMGAAGSIIGNANLVTKTYFPREILPLSSIGAALFHFSLQSVILLGAMAIFGYVRFWDAGMALIPLAIIVEIVFLVALALIVSSLNVFFRDVQYLLELALLAWFWMTPIAYASAWVQERMAQYPVLWVVYISNPMNAIVQGFQRALYSQLSPISPDGKSVAVLINEPIFWYVKRLLYTGGGAILLFIVGWLLFRRVQSRLAEEL